MKILDPGATNEIAAIYNVGSGATHEPQCLYVHHWHDAIPTPVSILNPLYEPLQYPILFPHGIGGWGDIYHHHDHGHWSQISWYRYHLLTEPRFNQFWRLGCEWIVDMFSCVEDQRLQAIKLGKQSKFSLFFKMILTKWKKRPTTNFLQALLDLLDIMQIKLQTHWHWHVILGNQIWWSLQLAIQTGQRLLHNCYKVKQPQQPLLLLLMFLKYVNPFLCLYLLVFMCILGSITSINEEDWSFVWWHPVLCLCYQIPKMWLATCTYHC